MANRQLPRATLLTVEEVAKELRVSRMTIYRLVHAGQLRSLRIGRSIRVPAEALQDYLGAQSL